MRDAPVAQLDRAPPSEGGGHTFESCRARHLLIAKVGIEGSNPFAHSNFLPGNQRVEQALRGYALAYMPLPLRSAGHAPDWLKG